MHPPPKESGIKIEDIKHKLGNSLGGHFISLRMAMLMLKDEKQRNILARVSTKLKSIQIFSSFKPWFDGTKFIGAVQNVQLPSGMQIRKLRPGASNVKQCIILM